MKLKIKSIINKIKSYLKELTIITIGVFVALAINNFKENYQSSNYYNASVETVKNEIVSNYSSLKNVIDKQAKLLDTINKYHNAQITISNLILEKGSGLQAATLSNSGLEFYKKNQINSIDFELMSRLIAMESTSKLINTKMEKLMDYLYPNFFTTSEESKNLFSLYLNNLLESEIKLLHDYDSFIDEYIENEQKEK